MKPAPLVFLVLFLAATISAQQPNAPKGGAPMSSFTLAAPAFGSGAAIPDEYTCRGSDISPVLAWSGEPAKTASFALIVDDPDAPAGTWVHWVIWNIPANMQLLPKDVIKSGSLSNGASQGLNDFGKVGYNGPCPPPGKTHRYFFRLYAVDVKFSLQPGAKRHDLDAAMKGHILGKAEHMGTFRR
jgi:Raf kinase inhibitor-like YbhB/YbcL family protein